MNRSSATEVVFGVGWTRGGIVGGTLRPGRSLEAHAVLACACDGDDSENQRVRSSSEYALIACIAVSALCSSL